jgi:hypothetical protein
MGCGRLSRIDRRRVSGWAGIQDLLVCFEPATLKVVVERG